MANHCVCCGKLIIGLGNKMYCTNCRVFTIKLKEKFSNKFNNLRQKIKRNMGKLKEKYPKIASDIKLIEDNMLYNAITMNLLRKHGFR